jgi:hypothetical protein
LKSLLSNTGILSEKKKKRFLPKAASPKNKEDSGGAGSRNKGSSANPERPRLAFS